MFNWCENNNRFNWLDRCIMFVINEISNKSQTRYHVASVPFHHGQEVIFLDKIFGVKEELRTPESIAIQNLWVQWSKSGFRFNVFKIFSLM